MSVFDEFDACRNILESLLTGVCVVDMHKKIVFWSDGAERITGHLRHEVIGRSCVDRALLHCQQSGCEFCNEECPMARAIKTSHPVEASGFLHHKSGYEIPVRIRAVPVHNPHGSIIGAVETFDELEQSDLDHAEKVLPGSVDNVTGLASPAQMKSHLRESLVAFIVKKKAGHGGHHGGAWKVAYADFVTAMMALFIVLWLLNSSKQVQEAVGGYFKDPTGTAKKVGSNMQGAGENFVLTRDNMPKLKEQLQAAMRQMVDFEKLKSHIDRTVTAEGLRIELSESASGTFFNSGSAKLNADGAQLLVTLAQELSGLPNKLSIEGHTDSQPYAPSATYGNWELSADRANAARRVMQSNGIRSDQIIQVRGFADQRLRKSDAPLDPANRRISVIVQYITKNTNDDTEQASSGKTEHQPDVPLKK